MLGVFLSLFLIFVLFIGVLVAVVSSSESESIEVKSNSLLHLKFEEEIIERGTKNPLEHFDFSSFSSQPKIGLDEILENIKKAETDDNISGIFIDASSIKGGTAIVEEIRNKLIDFKESGKYIIAYSEYYTQSAYYLASVADEIYLNPQGAVDFKGLAAQLFFFKNALEKLEIEPQIIRHGKFKSAVEPFLLNQMSESNREQTTTFIGSIWKHTLNGISKSRNITVDELNRIANEFLLQKAEDAVTHKLVDQLAYRDEILEILKTKTEAESTKKINFMPIKKYIKAPNTIKKEITKDKIAVIYAVGNIESGEGDNETIGSESISKAIRDARLDENVKAIVLRVNSPGGSALASEVMWREAHLAKKAKPFIVSMGNYAASGGYYIACMADTIVASPNTITGSIGVFGVMFNMQNFMNNKLGINIDTVKTNTHSDLGAFYRPLTTNERAIIQKSVEQVYDVFISRVAEGRGMTKEMVDSIGQGRVWSGVDAKRIGLVDVLGGLETAIEIAANKAGLEKYRIVSMPEQEDPFTKIMSQISGEAKTSLLQSELGENYKFYKHVKSIMNQKGIQARMEYEIEIY